MDDLPFVISVVRSGGFAGMRREWTIEVSAPDDADHWRPIIEALPWDREPGPPRPDGFVYVVRVDPHCATVPEHDLDDPWRHLVEEVRRRAEGS